MLSQSKNSHSYRFGPINIILNDPNSLCLSYFNKEFSLGKPSDDIDLCVNLVECVVKPTSSNEFRLDNNRFSISQSYIYSSGTGLIIDNAFIIQKIDGAFVVTIKRSLFSLRLLLLRVVYPILRYILYDKGFLLVKASSMCINDKAVLYMGLSGSGKTEFVLKSLQHQSFYISDTMSLMGNDGLVFPLNNGLHVFWRNFKSISSIKNKVNFPHLTLFSVFFKRIISLIFFGKLNLSTIVNLSDKYMYSGESLKLEKIYIDNLSVTSNKILTKKIFLINYSESFFFNHVLTCSLYADNNFFTDYWAKFDSSLSNVLSALTLNNK